MRRKTRVLSCFSGIGGIDLGLEMAGMTVVGQIEIDEFCTKYALEPNWPKVKRWQDICAVSAIDIRRHCGRIDVICGGPPCQDVSTAGKGKGLTGERSGLWREMWRLVRALRPTFVLIENVPAYRTKGADGVFASLEALSYTPIPVVVPACALGTGHERYRLAIIGADTNSLLLRHESRRLRGKKRKEAPEPRSGSPFGTYAFGGDGRGREVEGWRALLETIPQCSQLRGNSKTWAYADSEYVERAQSQQSAWTPFAQSPHSSKQHEWEEPRKVEFSLDANLYGLSCWLARYLEVKRNGATCQNCKTKILPELSCCNASQALQWAFGGFYRVPQAKILLTRLRGEIHLSIRRWRDKASNPSAKTSQESLRSLSGKKEFGSASYRPKPSKQRSGKYSNIVQAVPRSLAFESEKAWQAYCRSNALFVRPALEAIGNSVVPQFFQLLGQWMLLIQDGVLWPA